MSNRILNLVWGAERLGPERIGPLRRLVMAALADRVPDGEDSCFPGLQDIAARTELGLSTTKRILTGLKADGWLSTQQRPGYGTIYKIAVAKLESAQRAERKLTRATRLSQPLKSQPLKSQPLKASKLALEALPNIEEPREPISSASRSEASAPQKKKAPDPRHTPCRELVEAMLLKVGSLHTWTSADAGQLGALLRRLPSLTLEQFGLWLENLRISDDGYATKLPSRWLPVLEEYSAGSLDKYRRPKVPPTVPTALPAPYMSTAEKARIQQGRPTV